MLSFNSAPARLMPFLWLAALPLTASNHVTCSWDGPGAHVDPTKHNFTLYCKAEGYRFDVPGFAAYICEKEEAIWDNRVADYGFLREETLEMRTACNGDGFAGDKCRFSNWGICIPDEHGAGECKYVNKFDDCEWPQTFKWAKAPRYVSIYYQ
ncbi:hypothetical protein BDZ90DRAFT_263273 [Jaminaea rosea]|uniref:Uncharacterized protein n=1 Tax=Jaminaea rosea TaxID=1569628 RepID=A0A316UGV8_9BASI|nr:hypothetical protein BDZ90DRAFT_263273 [Jaminaea rosea]PWN24430.1 hypothetical protein BDZ90DRAFT_263273 [Jaminaea rosea]